MFEKKSAILENTLTQCELEKNALVQDEVWCFVKPFFHWHLHVWNSKEFEEATN